MGSLRSTIAHILGDDASTTQTMARRGYARQVQRTNVTVDIASDGRVVWRKNPRGREQIPSFGSENA